MWVGESTRKILNLYMLRLKLLLQLHAQGIRCDTCGSLSLRRLDVGTRTHFSYVDTAGGFGRINEVKVRKKLIDNAEIYCKIDKIA